MKSKKLSRPVRSPARAVTFNSVTSIPPINPGFSSEQRDRPDRYQTASRSPVHHQPSFRQALSPWSQNLPHPTPPPPPISPDLPGVLAWGNRHPHTSASFSSDRPAQHPFQNQSDCLWQMSCFTSPEGFPGHQLKSYCNQSIYSSVSEEQVIPAHQACMDGQSQALIHYPQTSLGDISELIYSAAVVTNLEDC